MAGFGSAVAQTDAFTLTEKGYLEREGVNVMAFEDHYPQGHQSAVEIVQHGIRTATNGDLRLQPTPGQWDPVPTLDDRSVNRQAGTITGTLSYPDPNKNRTGFNPIRYPDLEFSYDVRVEPAGEAVRVVVDLNEPLPEEWVGKVGFNLALYPGALFGKSWSLGGETGLFPRQPNGPVQVENGETQAVPFATGSTLTVAPEAPEQRLTIESETGELKLLDARVKHNKGWFIVRSLVPREATDGAIEWILRPHVIEGWTREPALQVSNVGYHPDQPKQAVVEMDADDPVDAPVRLLRVDEGENEEVLSRQVAPWDGDYLRYKYLRFNFSEVTQPGTYRIAFRDHRSNPFEISRDVYDRNVWQPTLDTFLPAQMCHMRVRQQNRVWHGLCHQDDARMAPTDSNHFDGYVQGPQTLTEYEPGETVPGLDQGGWHDAGDADIRIESQANEVHKLATMYEMFDVTYDETTIDQERKLVKMHQPDGNPDILQQVEHGILTILGGYRNLGRLYRGIIVPTLQQYKHLGDFSTQTDNLHYDDSLATDERTATHSGVEDDRLVFTEENPGREYTGIAALAIAGRVLPEINESLAEESVAAAEELWQRDRPEGEGFNSKVKAAVELLLTTEKESYRQFLLDHQSQIVEKVSSLGGIVGRALPMLDNSEFESALREAVAEHAAGIDEEAQQNPYGVPHELATWGAGWPVQSFGVNQYHLHRAFPDVVGMEKVFNALHFVLGTHPGQNTKSYVSGVGAESRTSAYGITRADWSYVPGGATVGTAGIGPDLPELKNFPYLWQQGEYVIGGGSTNYMFLVLATQDALAE
jgi:hypothetical protein